MRLAVRLWVEDKPGVLARVVSIVAAKGSNIEFLNVTKASTPHGVALVFLIAEVEPRLAPRLVNEMNRLVNVLQAVSVAEHEFVWEGQIQDENLYALREGGEQQ